MTVKEVTSLCRDGLTGDVQADLAFLEKQMRRLAGEKNADELLAAINEIALEQLPEEERSYFLETTCINGKRLDIIYRDALALVQEKNYTDALIPLRAIKKKIEQCFTKECGKTYYSFRNQFEYHTFLQLYGADQKFDRAPFDFAQYLLTYGFVLIELKRTDEALEALELAVQFNPVNCDVRFELAELFKITDQMPKLLSVIRDTLKFASSTYALARAYANLGYYCTEKRDFDGAAHFYYESLVYNNNPAIKAELEFLETKRMQKVEIPTHKQVLATFEKYEIPNGPSDELITLAVTLAGDAIALKKLRLGYYFYTIALDLTRDPQIRQRLENLKAEIEAMGEEANR